MFYEFAHRHTPCMVDGVAEKVILSRFTKGRSIFDQEYVYSALFSPTSTVILGAKVTTTDIFLVESLRKTPEGNNSCMMIKTNAQVTIQRLQVTVDNNGRRSSSTWNVMADAPMNIQHRTGNTTYKDGLLLAETVFVAVLQASVALLLNDRFLIDGNTYRVNDINLSIVSGLQIVQLALDVRE